MSLMRVKICGITRLEDALCAIEAGADALGFVFYEPSPRYISAEQAASIIAQLPPFVTCVGLFVNTPIAQVKSLALQIGLDLIQFHGDETAAACDGVGLPYIRALRMQPGQAIAQIAESYQKARAILLDAWVPGIPGGTGETFDWAAIPPLTKPLILAGGLTVDNVAQAVLQVRPYAVDVSGGVELRSGVKDQSKLKLFIQRAKAADVCDP
ncbi:N-(5'-phosphoribosyl)anthranilate isomerase [Thiopseudomonas alkaliphila]|uniref:N-(5'-phosphoribosyl)anthranilate isomerase n=1 Tax=Thiopseudomonas alkaliphila TaxID=1697053 RepID=A0A0K1XGX8_9GAMM|nr:phosphoribosylanthranilate isomerase [Thiopseudomonas alkaliphila]AKX45927.1 N-(5'-phosphoribosyl)anthranilate isomerase [Thiopseudomonas alkaliphila]AKX49975.1 N-(5'-phosphoribosyl)anthranilate isomerase [Thiopseudomonas alkaliphila]AKX52097.1 N-(5'-phosphoribosyl)anthranilate isomerase [Thiopseudomonas alkaliphila]AKX60635.1 N-(5'-phosphoribosyl)anthranilate isomerase [Thiopseudomonas alkaliphila]MDM1707072.1 phosphoribosylanthranilate isomerase [Thiopseudomonas alkaliphila]